MWWLIISIVILLVAYLFLSAPEKATDWMRKSFAKRAFAHRGLHDCGIRVPENSLAAFRHAIENGFGVELDIRMTEDKQIVVFHDDDISRACSAEGLVRKMTYAALSQCSLFGTNERIPLFSEVLHLFSGKLPLIVELKSDRDKNWSDELCEAAYRMLSRYHGPYAIESFDPYIVRWFREHAPEVCRGQLTVSTKQYRKEGLSADKGFALSFHLTNVLARPHFIASREEDRGFPLWFAKLRGAMSFIWTVRSEEVHQLVQEKEDAIIFEGYLPQPSWS